VFGYQVDKLARRDSIPIRANNSVDKSHHKAHALWVSDHPFELRHRRELLCGGELLSFGQPLPDQLNRLVNQQFVTRPFGFHHCSLTNTILDVLYDLDTMSGPTANRPTDELFWCQDELVALFETLVNVMFCAKDVEGRYLEVNAAFVRRTGKTSKRQVIGTRSRDHFVTELAERYDEQDQQVFATGRPLHDQLELIRRPSGQLGWYLTEKLPVMSPTSNNQQSPEVVGLVSVSRDLDTPTSESVVLEQLQDVVSYVRDHLGETLSIARLAAAARCRDSQLDRRMKKVFGISATQYILRVRVDTAAQMLAETDTPIAEIATNCGFYDQPDFTRRFARLTNATPHQFRLAHRD